MPPNYDELFQRLERNVERLQSDEVGLVERLELCRHSRALVARCVQELEKLGTEIEELFLEDLLDQVNDLGNPRPGARRRSARRPQPPVAIAQPAPTRADRPSPEAGGGAEDTHVQPPADGFSTSTPAPAEPDRRGLVSTHLRVVSDALRSVGEPVTLAALVEHGAPAALARLLARPGVSRTPQAVHHVTLLLTDDRVLPSALRSLGRLSQDPDVADWFDRGLLRGHDVLAELARELSPPAV